MGYKGRQSLGYGSDDKEKCHPAPHHALSMFLMISVDTMSQILEAAMMIRWSPGSFHTMSGFTVSRAIYHMLLSNLPVHCWEWVC